MKAPRFELYVDKSKNEEFRFRLISVNGKNILYGESYTTKQNCINGILSVKLNATKDSQFERKSSTAGDPYFVLKAENGEPLGISEMYNSNQARENGIEAVKRDAPMSELVDFS